MAEKSPIGSSQANDQPKRRPISRDPSGRPPIRRVSSSDTPPPRGLVRRESSSPSRPAGGPVQRTRPVGSAARPGVSRLTKSPAAAGGEDAPKVKIVTQTLPDGRVVKKRLVMKKKPEVPEKELTPEEQEQLRLEKERKEKEEAERKAEEERLRKEREAEEERIRLEREAEEKRKEEERIRLEKEAEQRRIEAEKVRQEKERQRIFSKIEYCRGSLGPEDKEKAKEIAEEMVKRNIKWDGYISLTSGIGGSVLK